MKVTTLNLQGFTNWEERKINILAFLEKTDSDIVLFQEAVFLPDISPYNQAQLLNQTLLYPYEYSSITRLQVGVEYETYREGLALISKYPVAKTDTIILKKAPLDAHNRIIQLIDVRVDGHIVKLANVHFSLTDTLDFATAHLQETLDLFASRGEERIIAGDFNLDHLEASSELWQEHYFASTQVPYVSYPSQNKRNDYVLIPKSYHFGAITTSGDNLSDHRALTTEIDLLSKLNRPRFADNIHLNGSRVLHRALDFGRNITR